MTNTFPITPFDLPCVQPLDPSFIAGREAVLSFIRKMDPDRVLAAFRRNAGLPDGGHEPYPGWENARIGGHALGSYFSGAAMAARALDDAELRDRLAYIARELRKCQTHTGSGFLSAASPACPDHPDIQFDIEEGRAEGETWVPWYALHKVLRGLTDIYIYTENEDAFEAALALGDWVADRCAGWDAETRRRILHNEYGGMNDALYLLYELTGFDRYRKAAEAFDDPNLYEHLTNDEDALSGVHANATIPKFIGALRRAKALPEEADAGLYFRYADAFFRRVVDAQMYATGGIGDMEHFRPDRRQDRNRTQCNAESCCVYNMMKLARMLFMMTGDGFYADYTERALLNARLGSFHPNGGTTYFNPMGTGFFKVFGNEDPARNVFWCCTGTGMEDFMKLGDSLYFREGETLIVNQYVSSELTWPEMGVRVSLQADVAGGEPFRMTIRADRDRILRVRFRVPAWTDKEKFCVRVAGDAERSQVATKTDTERNRTLAAGDMERSCVGTSEDATKADSCGASANNPAAGYVELLIPLEAARATEVEIVCPARLRAEGLPDADNVLAFAYGPYVLAAELPTDDPKEVAEAGIEVIAPAWKMIRPGAVRLDIEYGRTIRGVLKEEFLDLPEGCSLAELKEDPGKWMQRDLTTSGLVFRLGGMRFRPFYEIVEERYGIYWYF